MSDWVISPSTAFQIRSPGVKANASTWYRHWVVVWWLASGLYILDQPSIGLHSRDTYLLFGVMRDLQQMGNTVVVVEHDEEIIRAAIISST
jgi:hypothetical protein